MGKYGVKVETVYYSNTRQTQKIEASFKLIFFILKSSQLLTRTNFFELIRCDKITVCCGIASGYIFFVVVIIAVLAKTWKMR